MRGPKTVPQARPTHLQPVLIPKSHRRHYSGARKWDSQRGFRKVWFHRFGDAHEQKCLNIQCQALHLPRCSGGVLHTLSSAQADSGEVTVRISISTSGLDLRYPADAREVYRRLYFAARIACGNGNRVGLQSPASFVGCYEKALGEAVRFVNRPQLNIVYLATHTSRDAETYGIEIPARMAAK